LLLSFVDKTSYVMGATVTFLMIALSHGEPETPRVVETGYCAG
jgi:hypothetical protein